jgi:hypothetical protein
LGFIDRRCEKCAALQKELAKAAALTKVTKEKIFFGMIKVSDQSELNFDLKIDKLPSLVAIK